jgi:hypothetical protein
MGKTMRLSMLGSAAWLALCLLGCESNDAQDSGSSMTFFVTSVGPGMGANLGGLEGADGHCQSLAQAVRAGNRTWRAYLSTQASGGQPAVNARDRIGPGPWRNAQGTVIANTVEELHGQNNLTKETALTEKGEVVKGRGDDPNQHDILTGSQPDGTAYAGTEDWTCGNWTRGGTEGAAMLGHSDRLGLSETEAARSWNSSHLSRGGCSQDALRGTGGAGLFYCFAAD